jgi:hypothetical protein
MTAPIYKDLGKRASDLFSKEFPSDKKEIKAEWKGTTLNGVTFETSLVKDKSGTIIGTLTPKYKFKEYGTELSAEFNTKKDFKTEVSVSDQLVDGLKTTLAFNKNNNEVYGTFAYEFKHKTGSSTGTVDFAKQKGSTVNATGVLGLFYPGVYGGVSAEYSVGGNHLSTANGTLAYASPEFDVTAFYRVKFEEEKQEVGASYFHKVSSDLAVGSEIVYDVNTENKPKLTFGGQYSLNYDTTLKAKFDTLGSLSLSYQQKFNKNAKFTISTTVDTQNNKSPASLGVAINLTD